MEPRVKTLGELEKLLLEKGFKYVERAYSEGMWEEDFEFEYYFSSNKGYIEIVVCTDQEEPADLERLDKHVKSYSIYLNILYTDKHCLSFTTDSNDYRIYNEYKRLPIRFKYFELQLDSLVNLFK